MRASTRPLPSRSSSWSSPSVLAIAIAAVASPVNACGGTSRGAVDSRTQAPAAAMAPASSTSASAALPSPPAAAPGDAHVSAAFAALRDRLLDELLADDPSAARDLGLHAYDGKVAPISADALAARTARLRAAAADLAGVAPATLAADEALDRAELESWVASSLFSLVDMDAPRKSPGF